MATVASFLPDIAEADRNVVREMWDRLSTLPGGKAIFSKLIGRAAPYTGTINAKVVELRRGYAKVVMDDRRAVRNHLRCVHAIALANLVEVTGNIALAYTLPDDGRFIISGMSLEYLKKARGRITGVCEMPVIDSSERKEHEIHVQLLDEGGDVVVRGTLLSLVGPKKRRDRD
jgi:acyl-coenzyme A thioesterase PaaI-like protein